MMLPKFDSEIVTGRVLLAALAVISNDHSGQRETRPAAFAALVKSEIARWTPIIRAATIKTE